MTLRSWCLLLALLLPSGVQAAGYDLLWDVPASTPDTFQVLRCTVPGGSVTCAPTADLAGASVAGTIVTYHDATQVPGTLYCYTVEAITGGVRSSPSNVVCLPEIVIGLIAYYPLDAGTGTSIVDQTANHNDGTLVGGPTWVTGKFGLGVSLAGVGQAISIPPSASLNNLVAFTWAGWVFLRTLPWDYQHFADKGTGAAVGWSVGLDVATAPALDFQRYTTGATHFNNTVGNVTTNAWHHVVASYAGLGPASNIVLYLDGSVRTSVSSQASTGTALSDAAQALIMGNNTLLTKGGDMILDDVRIYNRALSQEDVTLLYTFVPPTLTLTPPTRFRLVAP